MKILQGFVAIIILLFDKYLQAKFGTGVSKTWGSLLACLGLIGLVNA